jgi:NitT/TauT family transport system substrate-binding protein
MKRSIVSFVSMCLALVASLGPVTAAESPKAPKKLSLAVSIYAGWMPWYYANETGILKKWADKYGVDISMKYMDYVPSIEAYVAGQADAVVCTNMETLDMPAAAGVDSSVVLMGDYSNGNDAILTRDKLSLGQLKGKSVYLVEKLFRNTCLAARWKQ